MSKFVYNGHSDRKGIVLAVLDTDGRPMVPARLVTADDPAAGLTVDAGRPFLVDHTDYGPRGKWLHDFCCSHSEFTVLSREALPPDAANQEARHGANNAR